MAHLSEELRAARQVAALGAGRPWEACGEIKCQFAARSKNRIHGLLSTRAKTVLEVRLGAAALSEGLRAARQAEDLCENG